VDNGVIALGERNLENLAKNRNILQNLLRKAMAPKRALLPNDDETIHAVSDEYKLQISGRGLL
jgi:hypothetical protein